MRSWEWRPARADDIRRNKRVLAGSRRGRVVRFVYRDPPFVLVKLDGRASRRAFPLSELSVIMHD